VLFKTPQAATLAARSSVFPQQHVASGDGWVAARGGDGAAAMGLDTFKVQQAPGPEDMLWQVGGHLGEQKGGATGGVGGSAAGCACGLRVPH
jgi:hypothetical protein